MQEAHIDKNKVIRTLLLIVTIMIFSIATVHGCEGFADCKKEADRGDVDAQVHLGAMYYKGDGAAQDYKMAEAYFLKAAEQGEYSCANNFGNAL